MTFKDKIIKKLNSFRKIFPIRKITIKLIPECKFKSKILKKPIKFLQLLEFHYFMR